MNHAPLAKLRQTAIRFTPDQRARIEKARALRGQTFQTFGHAAIMREVAVVEEEVRKTREERAARRSTLDATRETRAASRGLGIRDRMEDAVTEHNTDEAPAPATPTATVQVQVQTVPAPAVSTNIDVAALARVVVNGRREDRARMLAAAVQTITQATASRNEQVRLADQLDAEIRKIDGKSSVLDRVRARIRR